MNESSTTDSSAATNPYGRLFVISLLLLAAGSGAIALCYFFVDRPVAFYVHDHDLSRPNVFIPMTRFAPAFAIGAPIVLLLGCIRLAFGRPWHWEKVLFIIAINVLVSNEIKEDLKEVFGRTWPATWVDNNPSLLKDGVYGFHPFEGGQAYSSFPSGHTTIVVAVVSILWIVYPWTRLLGVLIFLSEVIGLVGMNYHFVSDVLGGLLLGTLTGMWAVAIAGLKPRVGNCPPTRERIGWAERSDRPPPSKKN